ncbi:uncharacterized protein A4U43_C04F12230 [Asparagus officinalis]|uniref:Uncharacterized protein n=1 Tax=Asparagus officinalis TaxID=4686 RepID=A0A5P1F0R2_ASPOF|nr:uncharacterized protein A4U43_C04F12230 [Asparagus officinalis]
MSDPKRAPTELMMPTAFKVAEFGGGGGGLDSSPVGTGAGVTSAVAGAGGGTSAGGGGDGGDVDGAGGVAGAIRASDTAADLVIAGIVDADGDDGTEVWGLMLGARVPAPHHRWRLLPAVDVF